MSRIRSPSLCGTGRGSVIFRFGLIDAVIWVGSLSFTWRLWSDFLKSPRNLGNLNENGFIHINTVLSFYTGGSLDFISQLLLMVSVLPFCANSQFSTVIFHWLCLRPCLPASIKGMPISIQKESVLTMRSWICVMSTFPIRISLNDRSASVALLMLRIMYDSFKMFSQNLFSLFRNERFKPVTLLSRV